jgi:hypothetical protein
LPLAAFGASRPHAPSFVYAAAAAVYVIAGPVCHQISDRSFHLWGVQLPVCARCLGIYAGGALAAIGTVAAVPGRAPNGRRASSWLPRQHVRAALCAAALPTMATLAYEWIAREPPGNATRAMAGVPLGAIVAWLVVRETRARAVEPERGDE